MKWSFAVCISLIACSALASPEKSVFSSYTEESIAGWASASEALAARLVRDGQVKNEADQCISDKGLAKNYRQFLVAKSIPLSTERTRYVFVRPSSQQYCQAFYGAHTFSFWIVGKHKRPLFSTSADALDVLSSSHRGMRDLLVSQCRGGYCYRTTFTFDAQAYREQSCVTATIETGESVPGCKP